MTRATKILAVALFQFATIGCASVSFMAEVPSDSGALELYQGSFEQMCAWEPCELCVSIRETSARRRDVAMERAYRAYRRRDGPPVALVCLDSGDGEGEQSGEYLLVRDGFAYRGTASRLGGKLSVSEPAPLDSIRLVRLEPTEHESRKVAVIGEWIEQPEDVGLPQTRHFFLFPKR